MGEKFPDKSYTYTLLRPRVYYYIKIERVLARVSDLHGKLEIYLQKKIVFFLFYWILCEVHNYLDLISTWNVKEIMRARVCVCVCVDKSNLYEFYLIRWGKNKNQIRS